MKKKKLTKQGKNLMAWLRHWEISSQVANAGVLSKEALEDEQKALATFRKQVRARYSKRGK